MHDYGPNRRYVSVHVEMPSNEDIMAIHAIIDKIEKSFLKYDGIHLIIHHDPIHPRRGAALDGSIIDIFIVKNNLVIKEGVGMNKVLFMG